MSSFTRSACLVFLLRLVLAQSSIFISDDSLGDYYPYAVHLPANATASPPPAVLMLGGTGSRGPADEVDELATYNGIGRRLLEYSQGNVTPSSSIAWQNFLTIVPIAPIENSTEWHIGTLLQILDDVQTQYGYDQNRLYLLGYSMGARDSWKLLLNNTDLFAAAGIAAGEPDSTYGDLATLVNIPIRHYQGSTDYVSIYEDALITQQNITNAGGMLCELIVLPNITHNNMADAPFYEPLFEWLLLQDKSNISPAPVPTLTTAGPLGSIELPFDTATNTALPQTITPLSTMIGLGAIRPVKSSGSRPSIPAALLGLVLLAFSTRYL